MQEKLPKYYILKQNLLQKIETGGYPAGSMIESERELMEESQFSRITVRKALDELVNEGYLYRIQGKGTYVRGEERTQDLFRLNSCTEDIKRLGRIPSKKLICSDKIPANTQMAHCLRIEEQDPLYLFGRIIYADQQPLNYTITCLPEKLFPGLDQYNLENTSLYQIIQTDYQVKITRSRRTMEAVLPNASIAGYLQISETTPVILFHSITYGIMQGKEVPVEMFRCYYRTDQYKFSIDQTN